MARLLVALAVTWMAAQAATIVAKAHGSATAFTTLVEVAGSRVCHQRPERSFHAGGVQWPVCARCTGLYLGGALGAWLGFMVRVRRAVNAKATMVLVLAALPTAATWLAEVVFGLPVGNVSRFVAALPLGAAIAATIVAVAHATPKPLGVN